MSNEIKETCRTIRISIDPGSGPHPISSLIEECGIDLEGIPDNAQTHELLEVAKRTGNATILSKEDVLRQAIVDERVASVKAAAIMAYSDLRFQGPIEAAISGAEEREEIEIKLIKEGAANILAKLPEYERTAIQKRAERFMEDARALIKRLKK